MRSPAIWGIHKTLDNRRSNLRLCTRAQNQANKLKKPGCSSTFKGVSWNKAAKKWQASIRVSQKLIALGLFNDEVLAARSYNVAAVEHFGEFALLNEI